MFTAKANSAPINTRFISNSGQRWKSPKKKAT